jgi:hypothetical protein
MANDATAGRANDCVAAGDMTRHGPCCRTGQATNCMRGQRRHAEPGKAAGNDQIQSAEPHLQGLSGVGQAQQSAAAEV